MKQADCGIRTVDSVREHACMHTCVWDVIICKTTLKIQIMCIQDLLLPDKGVACISELESYVEGNLAAVWATCVRQVASELPEKKRHLVLQKLGVGADVTILMSELRCMMVQKDKITVFSSKMVVVSFCCITVASEGQVKLLQCTP